MSQNKSVQKAQKYFKNEYKKLNSLKINFSNKNMKNYLWNFYISNKKYELKI